MPALSPRSLPYLIPLPPPLHSLPRSLALSLARSPAGPPRSPLCCLPAFPSHGAAVLWPECQAPCPVWHRTRGGADGHGSLRCCRVWARQGSDLCSCPRSRPPYYPLGQDLLVNCPYDKSDCFREMSCLKGPPSIRLFELFEHEAGRVLGLKVLSGNCIFPPLEIITVTSVFQLSSARPLNVIQLRME